MTNTDNNSSSNSPKRRGRPKGSRNHNTKDRDTDFLDPKYEVRIPISKRNLLYTPEQREEYFQLLTSELLLYYKTGVARQNIAKIYTPKQLRIKRLFWLCGGTRRVREACSVGADTISRWVSRESIQPKYWPVFAKLLEGKISIGDIAKVLMSE